MTTRSDNLLPWVVGHVRRVFEECCPGPAVVAEVAIGMSGYGPEPDLSVEATLMVNMFVPGVWPDANDESTFHVVYAGASWPEDLLRSVSQDGTDRVALANWVNAETRRLLGDFNHAILAAPKHEGSSHDEE